MSDQPDQPSGFETARITITRNLTDEGDDIRTEWTDGAPLIELLGLVEYARDSILTAHKGDDEA